MAKSKAVTVYVGVTPPPVPPEVSLLLFILAPAAVGAIATITAVR